jgi:glycosyl transferase family 87
MPVRRLLGWPDPQALIVSVLIGLLLAVYAWLAVVPVFGPHAPRADDFQDYLLAAHQLATGGDPYASFVSTRVTNDWSLSSGYIYPPAFAVTLIPLTWVSNDLAVRIWLILIQSAVLASLVIIYRVVGRPRRGELLCLVAVLTTFFPLLSSNLTGTMNAILLLLLTGAWAAWQRQRDVAAGAMVGVAAVFKLFPIALLPYLAWRRHWRLLAALGATLVGGLLLGLAVTSLAHNIYYFHDILPHLAAGTGYRENQSLTGVTARLCNSSLADNGGSAGWCGRLLDWPLVLALLAIVVMATSRASRSGLEFALAVTSLPLVSSVTWSFHLVILILPIALLIRRVFSGETSRRAGRVLIVAWLCFSVGPAIHYLLIFHPLPHWPGILEVLPALLTRLAGEAYVIGTLIIFGSLWFALRSEREAATLDPTIARAA